MDEADRPRDGLELQIIGELKRLLAEMEIDHENDGQQSLAALLSRAWATFLDDVCFVSLLYLITIIYRGLLGLGMGNHAQDGRNIKDACHRIPEAARLCPCGQWRHPRIYMRLHCSIEGDGSNIRH